MRRIATGVTSRSSPRAPTQASNRAASATLLCPMPRRIRVSTPTQARRAGVRAAPGSPWLPPAQPSSPRAFVPVSQSAPSHPSRSSRKGASLAASSAPPDMPQ